MVKNVAIPEYRVSVDDLKPGVYIRLESSWIDHPFLFNRFKINSNEQIRILRKLGVSEVICVPSKSDCLPEPGDGQSPNLLDSSIAVISSPNRPAVEDDDDDDIDTEKLWAAKRERMAKLKLKREAIHRCENKYQKAVEAIPDIFSNMATDGANRADQASEIINDMVDTFLGESDSVVHLMGVRAGGEGLQHHSLNVCVLAMMLGNALNLNRKDMHDLGLGALFHDIGKTRIDKSVLLKVPPYTAADQALIEKHPKMGVELTIGSGKFSDNALKAIFQHHETNDGRGFPNGLEGKKISLSAKITNIANTFDGLVNGVVQENRKTPYQAMSTMFSRMKNKLDMQVFSGFVRCMGIYPPGTVVQLSNDIIALVIAVNQRNPLKPSLLLYDPEVPKDEALIFDMEEYPELGITKSIHPSHLPKEIYDYLDPRAHVAYYLDSAPSDSAPSDSVK